MKLGGPIGPGGYEPPMSFAAEAESGTWAAPTASTTKSSRFAVAQGRRRRSSCSRSGTAAVRVVQDRFFTNLPPGTEAYTDGDGIDVRAGRPPLQVRLPVTPVESTASDTVERQVYTAYNALIERLSDGWEMAVGTVAIGAQPGRHRRRYWTRRC